MGKFCVLDAMQIEMSVGRLDFWENMDSIPKYENLRYRTTSGGLESPVNFEIISNLNASNHDGERKPLTGIPNGVASECFVQFVKRKEKGLLATRGFPNSRVPKRYCFQFLWFFQGVNTNDYLKASAAFHDVRTSSITGGRDIFVF